MWINLIINGVIIKNKSLDYSLRIFALNDFLNTLNKDIYSYQKFEFE